MNIHEVRDDLAKLFIMLLLVVCSIGALTGLLYTIVGEFSDQGRRWLCVGLLYAVGIAFAVGILIGRAYRSGYEASLIRPSQPRRDPAAPIINQDPFDPLDRLPSAPRVFSEAESLKLMELLGDLDA